MTLGQATGGRPGKVAAKPAPRPTAPSLGLGLGLGPKQRAAFQSATAGGNAGGWLGAHPNVAHNFASPTSPHGAARGNFLMSGGQSQRPGPRGGVNSDVMPQPPPAAPQAPAAVQPQQSPQQSMGMVGGNMYGQRQPSPWSQMGVNPGMQSVLQNRLGGGQNPWQNPSYLTGYGGGGQNGYGMAGGNMGGQQQPQYGQIGGMAGQMGSWGGQYQMPQQPNGVQKGQPGYQYGGGPSPMQMGSNPMIGGAMGNMGSSVRNSGTAGANHYLMSGPSPSQQGGGARYGQTMPPMVGYGSAGGGGGGFNPNNPMAQYPNFQPQSFGGGY